MGGSAASSEQPLPMSLPPPPPPPPPPPQQEQQPPDGGDDGGGGGGGGGGNEKDFGSEGGFGGQDDGSGGGGDFSLLSRECTSLPTTNGVACKTDSSVGTRTRCTHGFFFARSAPTCNAQSVLSNKNFCVGGQPEVY